MALPYGPGMPASWIDLDICIPCGEDGLGQMEALDERRQLPECRSVDHLLSIPWYIGVMPAKILLLNGQTLSAHSPVLGGRFGIGH
ncbi:MAG: hypothetical protein U5J78_04715 [Parasphingorhabdus sp.]|nr:hypothetical protein [Parasphingorhabdus sp.]